MKTRASFSKWLAAAVLLTTTMFAGSAQALPALQLDILGGTYDSASETILATPGAFTVYAYYTPKNSAPPFTDTYYLSAALVPQVKASATLGSFMFNGTQVDVTSGMTYGAPPLNDVLGPTSDVHDLQSHGIFDTYYTQLAFTFDPNNYVEAYDTQTTRLSSLPAYAGGTKMYYAAFTIDTANLNVGYEIHFDLFNESLVYTNSGTKKAPILNLTDNDIDQFAPFSHDAQSNGHSVPVPEPSTLLLLGSGLLGLGVLRRRS